MKWADIYTPLKAAGLVSTQADLSRLCGKAPSYASSRKSRGKQPSMDSLAHLQVSLDSLDRELKHLVLTGQPLTEAQQRACRVLYFVQQALWDELRARAAAGKVVSQ